jgi:hypothetical protein
MIPDGNTISVMMLPHDSASLADWSRPKSIHVMSPQTKEDLYTLQKRTATGPASSEVPLVTFSVCAFSWDFVEIYSYYFRVKKDEARSNWHCALRRASTA